jgi:DNA-binding NarL/FixJ family response regulator
MIRIVVADDHPLVRAGLEMWLSSLDDMDVVGVAANGQEAIDLTRELSPDVVVVDIAMPVLDGISAIRQISAFDDHVAIIALSTYQDQVKINAALDAGAIGYLLKDVDSDALVTGIRSVMTGGMALSPVVAAQLFARETNLPPPTDADTLTPREREILDLIATGHANKEIARLLQISEKTVKSHCGRLFQRIGATDRTQAAIWALKRLSADDSAPTRLRSA